MLTAGGKQELQGAWEEMDITPFPPFLSSSLVGAELAATVSIQWMVLTKYFCDRLLISAAMCISMNFGTVLFFWGTMEKGPCFYLYKLLLSPMCDCLIRSQQISVKVLHFYPS